MILAIFGPTCETSSGSAGRPSCSENRSPVPPLSERLGDVLKQRLARFGSMEYVLTWKRRATPQGRVFYQLRASPRRTSGRGCGGWPTPRVDEPGRTSEGFGRGLAELAEGKQQLAGWPTPSCEDTKTDGAAVEARVGTPEMRTCDQRLRNFATLAGWPTPDIRAHHAQGAGMNTEAHSMQLGALVPKVSGWPTPKTPTGGAESAERKQELGRMNSGGGDLQAVIRAAGWATPTQQDSENVNGPSRMNRNSLPLNAEVQVVTGAPLGSPAATGPRGVLNPAFPLWLMGFPEAWLTCAPGWAAWTAVQALLTNPSATPDASAREH